MAAGQLLFATAHKRFLKGGEEFKLEQRVEGRPDDKPALTSALTSRSARTLFIIVHKSRGERKATACQKTRHRFVSFTFLKAETAAHRRVSSDTDNKKDIYIYILLPDFKYMNKYRTEPVSQDSSKKIIQSVFYHDEILWSLFQINEL